MRLVSGPVTRRLALGLGIALASALAATQGAAAATLKVGANIGNLPWEFQDAKGETVGFEIDLMKEVAKRLGDDVTFVNIPFTGLFAAVQSGQIDAAVSSITITPKRLASVSFAQPYYDSDQSLTVMAKSGIADLKGLAGKTVGVDTGSTGDIYATQHQAELKIADIRRYEGLAPAMLDLAAGRIDGYISDIPALQYYVKDKPAYKVVERIPTGERYSVMLAKDSPLLPKVDAVLTTLKAEGFIAKLHQTWFGVPAEASTSTVMKAEIPKP